MKKNFGEIFGDVQVDPITGKYFVYLPEEVISELSWYEDTKIQYNIDGGDLIILEINE
jgi:hypothetical protein